MFLCVWWVGGFGQVCCVVECCVHPANSGRIFSFATQSRFSASDMNRSWGSFSGKEFLPRMCVLAHACVHARGGGQERKDVG